MAVPGGQVSHLVAPGIKTFDDRNKMQREPVRFRAERGVTATGTRFAAEELADWLKQLGLGGGNRVLDVGCGTGRFARAASGLVGNRGLVLAVDVDAARLRGFERSKTNERIFVACAEGRDLPVRTAEFDAAILGFVLHELPEPYPVLNEVRRTLREDGRLLVFEWLPSVPVRRPGARRLAPEQVERLFDSAGFRVEDVVQCNDAVYAVRGSMAKVLCCGAYSPVLV